MPRLFGYFGAGLFFLISCSEISPVEINSTGDESISYANDLLVSRFYIDGSSLTVPYQVIHDFDSVVVLRAAIEFENEVSFDTDTSDLPQKMRYLTAFSELLVCGVSQENWSTEQMLQLLPEEMLWFELDTIGRGHWGTFVGATAGEFERIDAVNSNRNRVNCLYFYSCPDLGHLKDSIIRSRRDEIARIKFLQ
jgi:hypothetical protein